VITEGFFPIPQVPNSTIHISPDGSFSERIISRRYAFDTIDIRISPWPYSIETYVIEPINFCLRPNTLHIQNIITTALVTRIEKQEFDFENAVVVSPNPFTNNVAFYFNLVIFDPTDELSLLIFDQQGEKINEKRILPNVKRYDWIPDENIPPCILIYHLKKNNHIIKTGKMIRL